MTTLLKIVQNVAAEVSVGIPNFVMAATDALGIQFRTLANSVMRDIGGRHDWAVLQLEKTFPLVDGQSSYDFPIDFDRFVNRTQWDRSAKWEMLGPLTPQEWQRRKSGLAAVSTRRRFRVKPDTTINKFFIDPTPSVSDAGLIMVYEYISNGWILDQGGVQRWKDWHSDNDTSLFNPYLVERSLIWRFLRAKGLSYDEEKDTADRLADSIFSQETGQANLPLYRRARVLDLGSVQDLVPESGYGTW